MGNQGTADDGFRRGVELIRWRRHRAGPRGPRLDQPADLAAGRGGRRCPARTVPQGTSTGTCGSARRRSGRTTSAYRPFDWRGWWDFGTGALGDMACHTVNLPFMGLQLGCPTSVSAVSRQPVNPETCPVGCTITYEFPQRGDLVACRLTWYERGRPADELLEGIQPGGSGCLIVGQKGRMFTASDYGDGWRLLPQQAFENFRAPERTLPNSPGHHAEWLRACKGGTPALSNFVDYACQLTETALLGNVALRPRASGSPGTRLTCGPAGRRTPTSSCATTTARGGRLLDV